MKLFQVPSFHYLKESTSAHFQPYAFLINIRKLFTHAAFYIHGIRSKICNYRFPEEIDMIIKQGFLTVK